MAAAEHSGPNGHEVCNGVVSIADELAIVSEDWEILWAWLRLLEGYLQSEPISKISTYSSFYGPSQHTQASE
jgi:hypothetical protein